MFVFVRSTRAVVGVFHPFNGSLVGLGLRGSLWLRGQIEGYKYHSPSLCPKEGFFHRPFPFLGPTFNQETENLGSQENTEGGTLKVS